MKCDQNWTLDHNGNTKGIQGNTVGTVNQGLCGPQESYKRCPRHGSDIVKQWRLLLEEYAPKIVYIKGIHNKVTDTVSWLEYNPALNPTNEYTHTTLGVSTWKETAQRWKLYLHHWQSYNKSNAYLQIICIPMNEVAANCSEEDDTFSLTTTEIAEA